MTFYTARNIQELLFPPKPLTCPPHLWTSLLRELRSRGRGNRESGAFLLGTQDGSRRRVTSFIPYDDIDPNCLQGYITFDGSKMDRVWAECRRRSARVIADVHTHPGGYGQSGIDKATPMIPEGGHIALIVPNFADRRYGPGQIGIYEFAGYGRWYDRSDLGTGYFALRRFG